MAPSLLRRGVAGLGPDPGGDSISPTPIPRSRQRNQGLRPSLLRDGTSPGPRRGHAGAPLSERRTAVADRGNIPDIWGELRYGWEGCVSAWLLVCDRHSASPGVLGRTRSLTFQLAVRGGSRRRREVFVPCGEPSLAM